MEPREEEKREPEAPEVRPEPPRLKRFRIVKLEERIAPLAGGGAPIPTPPSSCPASDVLSAGALRAGRAECRPALRRPGLLSDGHPPGRSACPTGRPLRVTQADALW
jgi:hypothetical protein